MCLKLGLADSNSIISSLYFAQQLTRWNLLCRGALFFSTASSVWAVELKKDIAHQPIIGSKLGFESI